MDPHGCSLEASRGCSTGEQGGRNDALKAWAVSVAFGTVSFRVDVSQALLAQMDGSPLKSKSGYVERVTRHKRLFAQIAGWQV